jgi:hypothetical protein
MTGRVLRWCLIGVSLAVRDDGCVINETRYRTMRHDRRHPVRFADRHTLHDALINRARTRLRRGHGLPPPDASRSRRRGPRPLPPRESGPPRCATSTDRPQRGVRRKTLARGATLLDVMFAVMALAAGAQGFARWQAAGGVTSAELATIPNVTMLAMPARAPALARAPSASDAWRVHRRP